MKSPIALLVTLGFCHAALACDIPLEGTWRSDAAATMAFNRAKAKLEKKQEAFLSALMGKMTLTFTGKAMLLHLPETQVPVKGELKTLTGFDERKTYKVLFCNSRKVVFQTAASATDESDVSTYYFIDHNTMWTYTGGNNPIMPDLHLREYFRRLR